MIETANQTETMKINGQVFARMLCGGAALLSEHIEEINDLNVFPVPDGDTGTNMARTMQGGLAEISDTERSIGELSHSFSHGVLLGARGNSGVILSQIFAGIGEELEKYSEVGAAELALAYRSGIKKAYASVKNPTEGTILTVFRESSEYAADMVDEDSAVEDFFRFHIEQARRSLLNTKELLPVLAEADVVDSGGAGYLYIAIGMYEALTGKRSSGDLNIMKPEVAEQKLNINLFTRNSKLQFGYCTEFLLRLTADRVDPDSFEVKSATDVLEELGGESIVAYKTDDILKIHVHTFRPGEVLTRMQAFGEFLSVKIENMALGHSETPKKKSEPPKKYAVVTVASGEGMKALFTDMGADAIIDGGQTANPSTEDFIRAFESCNAENLIVLPNNKNVVLAARQAAELYEKSRVHIINTRTPMECYAALSVITPGISNVDSLVDSLNRAAGSVVGSEITRAVRDVTLQGKEIREGDYIAITGDKISAVADSAEECALRTVALTDTDEYEILTLFVGEGVSYDGRDMLVTRLAELYPDLVIEIYESGLSTYDYLIAIE